MSSGRNPSVRNHLHLHTPIFKLLFPIFFVDKIFDLHLLELADAENKIARRYLVAERLPICAMPNGSFGWNVSMNIFKIDEHPLRGLGAQV